MVWILFFLISLIKYSSISLILLNWSSLVGDFFSNNKIPESTIQALHTLKAKGTVGKINVGGISIPSCGSSGFLLSTMSVNEPNNIWLLGFGSVTS